MRSLGPLAYPNFRALLVGRTVAHLGNAAAPIALGFAVLDLTGSLSALGLVVAARSVANVALLLVGGVLADRLPRGVVVTGSEVLAAVSQAAIAAVVLAGLGSVPLLAALGVLSGAAAALSFPATAALVPQSVPGHLLQEANALSRLGMTGSLVGGAAAGGAAAAVLGPGWALAACAGCFAVAALAYALVSVPAVRDGAAVPTGVLRDLRDGWDEFVARPWVWIVVLQFCFLNAAWVGGTAVLGLAVADDTVGRVGWGLALAVQGLGLVAGGLLALRVRPDRLLRYGVAACFVMAGPLVALGSTPTLVILLPAMFVAGVAVEQFTVAWDVALQQNVPPDRLARVYSYDALGSFLAIPAGEVAVGPIAELVGIRPTLLGCAAVIVVVTAAALAHPSVRGLRRRGPGGVIVVPGTS